MSTEWQGRWLTGSRGTERVVTLSEQLALQTKQCAEITTMQQFPCYQPWMCCPARYDVWSVSPYVQAMGDRATSPAVVDPQQLQFLQHAFSTAPEQPFGHLKTGQTNFRICDSLSADLLQYSTELNAAIFLLTTADTTLAVRWQHLVCQVIPLGPLESGTPVRREGYGMSNHLYRGGIFVGLPSVFPGSTIELAINLAHELGHQAAMVYQYADCLLETEHATPVYSAVRKTERPAIMSFHAVVALLYMVEFLWHARRLVKIPADAAYAGQRWKTLREDLAMGLAALQSLQLSVLGKGMLQECEDVLEACHSTTC